MTKEMLWLLMGHLVCIGQWAAFIMVSGPRQEIPLPLPVGSPAGSSISGGLDPA